MCLTTCISIYGEFVGSELATEGENTLTVSRPSLLCDLDIKKVPLESITGQV